MVRFGSDLDTNDIEALRQVLQEHLDPSLRTSNVFPIETSDCLDIILKKRLVLLVIARGQSFGGRDTPRLERFLEKSSTLKSLSNVCLLLL